ncbi:hypothetical protein MMC30_004105 [Trapelia coarctata]|nr:hypothetical protein [Trapelia coarctata]
MPQSPYQQTVYPPIANLESYRYELRKARSRYEDGNRLEDDTIDIGDLLLEHCDFLEAKLDIKKRDNTKLVKQNEAFRKEIEALKVENESQKKEVAALKGELEKMAAMAAKQHESNADEAKAKAEPEKGGDSPETLGAATPRKRSAETDLETEETAAKKGRP